MRYYLLNANIADYSVLIPEDRTVFRTLRGECGSKESILHSQTFTVQGSRQAVHRIGDFIHFMPQVPVLSSRAVRVLVDYCRISGSFVRLRLAYSEAELYALCIKIYERALDMEKSKCEYFKSGQLMNIPQPVLRNNFNGTAEVFMLKEFPALGLVVSQNVLDDIRNENLTGYLLEELPVATT